jgi:molybdate transport system permease protein
MFSLSPADWSAIGLTLKLALAVTAVLLLVATPLAWWLARTSSWLKAPIAALVAMPLVLPPTVLGFYFLILLGPEGPLGYVGRGFGLSSLLFTFWGLVLASCVYSLPFVVQPIYLAMQNVSIATLEAAASLGAGPWDRFTSVVMPLAKPGFITGAILGFAHTVGEFGVVLMVGGNIPRETRVLSIQIYDHVEALDYASAHRLSAALVLFSFLILLVVYRLQRSDKNVKRVPVKANGVAK